MLPAGQPTHSRGVLLVDQAPRASQTWSSTLGGIRKRHRRKGAQRTGGYGMVCSASEERLKIVFVATEVAPWSKVGGLGDVMAALPAALAARGHQVMTVAPRYATYPDAFDTGVDVPLQLPPLCGYEQPPGPFDPPLPHTARYFAVNQGGVNRVFVDHKVYAGLATDIYGSADTYMHGDERQDLDLRYSVLCQAALAAPLLLWGSGAPGSGSPGYASQTAGLPVPMPGQPDELLAQSNEPLNEDELAEMWARNAGDDIPGEGLAQQQEELWSEEGPLEDELLEQAEERWNEEDPDVWPRPAGDTFPGEGLAQQPEDLEDEDGPSGEEYTEPEEEQVEEDLDMWPRTSGTDFPVEGLPQEGEERRDEEGPDQFPRTAGEDGPTDDSSDRGLQWSGGEGLGLQIWGPGGVLMHQLEGWEQGAVVGLADGGTTVPELQAFACQSQASWPDAGEQGKPELIWTPADTPDRTVFGGHAAQPLNMHPDASVESDANSHSSGEDSSSVRQPVPEVAMTPPSFSVPEPGASEQQAHVRALQTSTVPDRAVTSNQHPESLSGGNSLGTTAGQALKDGPGQDLNVVAPGALVKHQRGFDAHLEEGRAGPDGTAQQSRPLRHAAGILRNVFFRESPQPDMEATSASEEAVKNSNMIEQDEGLSLASDLAGTHGDGPHVNLRRPAQLASTDHAAAQSTQTPNSVSPVHPRAPQQLMSEAGLPPQVPADVQPRRGPLGGLMRFAGFVREHLENFVGMTHSPAGAPLPRRSDANHAFLDAAGVASSAANGARNAAGEAATAAGEHDQKWIADGGNRSAWQGGAAAGTAVFGASVIDADTGRSQGGDPTHSSGFPTQENPLGLAAAPHPAFEGGLLGPGVSKPHLDFANERAGALGQGRVNPRAYPLQVTAEGIVCSREMTTESLNIPWEATLGDEQGLLLQRHVETQHGNSTATTLPLLINAPHRESGNVHAGSRSPPVTSRVADEVSTLPLAGSDDGLSASPHNISEPTILQGREEAPDGYYSDDFAPEAYYSDDQEVPSDVSRYPAEEDVPAPAQWETDEGAAAQGPLTFVCNDWPCAPLVLRLRNLRVGTPQMKGCPVNWSWPSGANGKQSERIVRFRDQLASSLEEARAIFCIHNLAYQGRFARENFWNLCLPPQALLSMAWPPPPIRSIVVGGAMDEAAMDIEYGVSCDLHGIPFDSVVDDILNEGRRQDREVEQRMEALLGNPLIQPDLNWMQAAVLESDMVVTVSPRYADEICNDEAMGCGLRRMLETRGVRGIMNGIDTIEWDPENDFFLPEEMRYTAASAAAGKARAKQAFQERFQLQLKPNVPLFACIGRLTDQKGIDVLLAATPDLLLGQQLGPAPNGDQNNGGIPANMQLAILAAAQARGEMQLAILGTGTRWMEAALSGLSDSYPGKAAGIASFSESVAHLLLAAADYVVVPSRFEPCGLVAQCGVRYGAVPVVASVGGLYDLVTPEVGIQMGVVGPPGSTETSPAAVEALTRTMKQAAALYGTELYKEWQRECMALDVSWDKPAIEWEEAVLDVLAARPANMPRPTKRRP